MNISQQQQQINNNDPNMAMIQTYERGDNGSVIKKLTSEHLLRRRKQRQRIKSEDLSNSHKNNNKDLFKLPNTLEIVKGVRNINNHKQS